MFNFIKLCKTELGTGRETLVPSNTTILPTMPQREQVLRASIMSQGIEYDMFNGRTNTI